MQSEFVQTSVFWTIEIEAHFIAQKLKNNQRMALKQLISYLKSIRKMITTLDSNASENYCRERHLSSAILSIKSSLERAAEDFVNWHTIIILFECAVFLCVSSIGIGALRWFMIHLNLRTFLSRLSRFVCDDSKFIFIHWRVLMGATTTKMNIMIKNELSGKSDQTANYDRRSDMLCAD